MELVVELAGWFGALTVLAGYAAFSLGWLRDDRLFQVCSLAGSAALLVNGYHHGAMPAVVVNSVWGVISIIALARAGRTSRRLVPVAAEQTLVPPVPVRESPNVCVDVVPGEE